jgi:hypothetical protein
MATQHHPILTIAGIKVSLDCDDADLASRLVQHYRGFIDHGTAEFSVAIYCRKRSGGPIFPYLRVVGGPEYIHVIPGIELEVAEITDYLGVIDLLDHRARLSFSASSPLDEIEYFLRILYALLIFRSGGVMLHAAGILRAGGVYVFFGQSGAGKSTVARFSPPEKVLNDDLLGVLPSSRGWTVHATPFWNSTQVRPNRLSGSLGGMFRLIQDSRVYTERMSPGEAVAELLASIPVIPDIPGQHGELIHRCIVIQERNPIKTLHFLPDASFWEAIVSQSDKSLLI